MPKRVLLLDCEISFRVAMESAFGHRSFEIVLSGDWEGIMALIESYQPDLFIFDPDSFPSYDYGLEFLHRIREKPATSRLLVIILTVRDEDADILRGHEAGADCYIVKPCGHESLFQTIDELLNRSRQSGQILPLGDYPYFGRYPLAD